MMEETLIRESANRKAGNRTYNEAPTITKQPTGPPISFINPAKQTDAEFKSKDSIFAFGEQGEDKKTADESGESNESGKSESEKPVAI